MAPRPLRKTSLGCKTGKLPGEDGCTFKGAENELRISSFSKADALREKKSQEGTCPKFSQAERLPGQSQASLSSSTALEASLLD